MSDMKTTRNDADVSEFLNCVENPRRAADARKVTAMMQEITGLPPAMWGDSIIGFGSYRYKRKDGSKHSFMLTGLSPRKAALTIYIMPGFSAYSDLLARLGKHRHSVSCLYLGRLDGLDLAALKEMIRLSVVEMRRRYPDAGA